MRSIPLFLRKAQSLCAVLSVAFGLMLGGARAVAQEAMSPLDGPYVQPPQQAPAPIVREPAEPEPPAELSPDAGPLANYDPALFQKRIPKDQLAFSQFAGMPPNVFCRDKQFHMKGFVLDCTYHYGSDKSMDEALDEVIEGSSEPVRVRDGRYVMLSGHQGPYLSGKAF